MTKNNEIDNAFQQVLDWTNQKLRQEQEPPWLWYQLMKLREAIQAIRTGEMNVPIKESLIKPSKN